MHSFKKFTGLTAAALLFAAALLSGCGSPAQ